MPVISYSITCTKKERVAPGVYELRFSKPAGFTFKAGQFVLFDVPMLDNPSDVQPRAYSIGSINEERELIFVVKLVAGGRASRWVEEVLKVGTSVTMKGPFGLFILNLQQSKQYVFVATGAGVAPFRSQIKWALEIARDTRPMQLVFGVRETKDLFWVEEFQALEKKFPNFKCYISLTGGQPDWHGHRGRVQQIIPQVISDFQNVSMYICGAPTMVNDVKKMCLETWKMPKADVHAEGYI